jgi:hypothetical protein
MSKKILEFYVCVCGGGDIQQSPKEAVGCMYCKKLKVTAALYYALNLSIAYAFYGTRPGPYKKQLQFQIKGNFLFEISCYHAVIYINPIFAG